MPLRKSVARALREIRRMLPNAHHRNRISRAVKMRLHFCGESHDAVRKRKKRIVAGARNITPGMIFRTPLANDDLADKNWLAVLNFDAKPLGGGFAP